MCGAVSVDPAPSDNFKTHRLTTPSLSETTKIAGIFLPQPLKISPVFDSMVDGSCKMVKEKKNGREET